MAYQYKVDPFHPERLNQVKQHSARHAKRMPHTMYSQGSGQLLRQCH
jgi:hypothetical protein